jgi:hypothetical protein
VIGSVWDRVRVNEYILNFKLIDGNFIVTLANDD